MTERGSTGRLHRALRRIFLPAAFRRRHGEAMGRVFEEAVDGAGGWCKRARLWVREVRDLAETGRRLRRERRRHGVDLVARRREISTGGGRMTGLVDDARHAVRSLVRRPVFALFVLVTVALGVGSATAIFSTLEGVVLRPVPYEDADRMVTLARPIGNAGSLRTPAPEQVEVWAGMDDVFERVDESAVREMTLTGAGEPVALEAGLIRPGFHELTGRRPILGRTFTAREGRTDARVVMLGHGLWTRRFGGDPGVLGRTVELDGEPWEIVGVMPPRTPLLSFTTREVDLFRPLPPETVPSPPVAVLREGVTVEQANARLETPLELAGGESATGIARSLVESMGARMGETLRILMIAVLAVLLVACVNVSNLLLSRAHRRRRETAVRAALGGGRVRLARQMMAEGMALGILGGALGVVLAFVGLETILSLRPAALDAFDSVRIDGRVLAFALIVTVSASVLFSLIPMWQSTREDALACLRGGARNEGEGSGGSRFRWLLVTTEVALSFTLVVGSMLVTGALVALQRQDPGFRADEVAVVEVRLPSWRYEPGAEATGVLEAIGERMSALPGVVTVGRALGLPGEAGIAFGTVQVEGKPASEETHVLHGPPVDERYFAALGQPLLRGRGFTREEVEGDANVLVLGEGTARRFFDRVDVVGERIRMSEEGEWSTVVGVTVDVPMTGLSALERPLQIYWPLRARYGVAASYLVRVRASVDPASILPAMREVVRGEVPDARIDKTDSLAGRLSRTLARERFASALLTAFAGLALGLAAVGLYGVISQVVGQRTREIGVRMALGAGRGSIRWLVLRQGAVATGAGIVAGMGLTVVGLELLSSRIIGLDGGRVGVFALGALVLGGLTLLATWLPARRATGVDPVRAMRTE